MAVRRTLALGVGNTLLTDEAAGPRALAAFAADLGDMPGLTCVDAGTLSFTLAETIGAADALIVFDAARLGGGPRHGAHARRCRDGQLHPHRQADAA